MSKWFVMRKDSQEVSGPYEREELLEMRQRQLIEKDVKIWGRSMTQWLNVEDWQQHLKTSPSLKNSQKSLEPVWYFAHNGDSYGPMTYNELINDLKNNFSNIGQVYLWTVGMKNWAPVFDFFNITNELGVNQRQHPRANITGNVSLQIDGEDKTHIIAKLCSISQGGAGLTDAFGLTSSDQVTIDITPVGIDHKIKATAEVCYVTGAGFAGLKFKNISAENASSIIQYIKNTNSQFKLKKSA